MRLREHPKIPWPLRWSEWGESSLKGEEGILRDVDLIEPTKFFKATSWKVRFILPKSIALIPLSLPDCTKKLSPLGRPIRELGELDF
jgi:hypothetical protein